MRRSPADSTNRSLAAFGKLQHIRVGLGEGPHTAELYRERLATVRIPVESDH